ncbi:serine hydrolase domain-containing protein [Hydrogenophaga sp. RWCD_12]|uniref:serine hydrolase domain-containing protein n=1 Tax=Hydrogenophaga sp. RWCD_12 TaxID=3391190 RepID=UPI003984F78C
MSPLNTLTFRHRLPALLVIGLLSIPWLPAKADTQPAPVGAQPAPSVWAAALDAIDADGLNVHSVLIQRGSDIVAERYREGSDRGLYSLWSSPKRFGPDDLHDMRSISKSVIGLLYGILLERGTVPSLETPVASLYAQHSELNQPPKNAIQIRHLLTMSAGLAWNEPSPVRRTRDDDQTSLVWTGDICATVFGHEVQARPGETFVYSGGLTSVLADIMERSTGRPLTELVDQELFQPLGIRGWTWTRDLRSRPIAYAGLRLLPRDLLKIGVLVLQGGRWQGRQLVPAAWVKAATSPQLAASPDLGYGYQWWTSEQTVGSHKLPVIQAIGNGGQRLYVVPELDMVVAMTAGDYGTPDILTAENRVFSLLLTAATQELQRATTSR